MGAVFRILNREQMNGSKRMFDESRGTKNPIQSAAAIGRSDIGDWIRNLTPSKADTSSACQSRCFFLSYIHLISPSIYTHTQVGHQKPFPSISCSHYDEAPWLNDSMMVLEFVNIKKPYQQTHFQDETIKHFLVKTATQISFGRKKWYFSDSVLKLSTHQQLLVCQI